MQALVEELKQNNMIMYDLHYSYVSGGPFPASGLIGAVVEVSKTWHCSLTCDYLYLFKVKDFFSYKGIKFNTITKIKISDILEIEWRPKTFSGFFVIKHTNGKIKGVLTRGESNYNDFEKVLDFLVNDMGVKHKIR